MRAAIVNFRVSGFDGVSLEAKHWKRILTKLGHEVTFIAGELDDEGIVIPELQFTHPKILSIHRKLIEEKARFEDVEDDIRKMAGVIEGKLRIVFENNEFDRVIASNVFSLPINLAFGPALLKIVDEFRIPTVSRDHDFWWDRQRYKTSDGVKYFAKYFPPKDPFIRHTVLNSLDQEKLKETAGINAAIVPDSFDFANVEDVDGYCNSFRDELDLKRDDVVFLQATRIVPRKNIEASIELVRRLNNPSIVLVLAGHAGDEGLDYFNKLKILVKESGIRAKFVGNRISVERRMVGKDRHYTLWDAFKNADFVTYPTKLEGFGNQFLETVAFKKPMMVNCYDVFKADIEPLGFDVVKMDGVITDEVVDQVWDLLNDPVRIKKMVEINFEIARKNFSYESTAERMFKLGLIPDTGASGQKLLPADLIRLFDPQLSE